MARCAVCDGEGARKCNNCKSIAYCSDKCKQSDLMLHKMVCDKFAKFATQHPRPSDDAFLAIKLDIDSSVPKLVWVQGTATWNMKVVKTGNAFNNPSKHDYLGATEPPFVEEKRINAYRGGGPSLATLDHTIAVHHLDNFKGQMPNQCIANITKGQQPFGWCGSVIVISWPGLYHDPVAYQDVTAADLHSVVEFLKSYAGWRGAVPVEETSQPQPTTDTTKPDPTETDPTKTDTTESDTIKKANVPADKVETHVQAVMISSSGDQQMLENVQKYELVKVSKGHPLFGCKTTPISAAVKFPLVTRRFNLTLSSSIPENEWSPHENPSALAMHLDIGILSKNWGGVDKQIWPKNSMGYLMVVREDGHTITEKQVEVMAEFCHHVERLIHKQMAEEQGLDLKAKAVLRLKFLKEHVCKEQYEKFFKSYKEKRCQNGDTTWYQAFSPYSA